ncbi:MAG: N-formylglutamate amidohydrolase [Planctomycetota bacterium]
MAGSLWIVTCEHGGNHVPARYAKLFSVPSKVLASHRGHDPGALVLAKQFARVGSLPLFFSTTTRLLVELNRSLHHPSLFSEYARSLPDSFKEELIDGHYRPYRDAVVKKIEKMLDVAGSVIHLSAHSFTPVFHGETRRCDVGFLYDPRRPMELEVCDRWRVALAKLRPDLILRRNYPYQGKSDGFTTFLRKVFPADRYAGIELEVNQRWLLGDKKEWRRLRQSLVTSRPASL